MRLFGWMQNKLNGKQGSNKANTSSSTNQAKQEAREEFSDWPQGLLAIGTFGNSETKENNGQCDHDQDSQNSTADHDHQDQIPSSSHDQELLDNFTPEEVGKLQKELTKLLSRSKPNVDKEIADLPLDRFLNCPSSLEVDRRISSALYSDNSDHDYKLDEDIDRTISVILGRCKDVLGEANSNNKKAGIIGKKSISFLFKKMFVCRSGFAPQPSLRDTLQESRMEKLLRMMLHKKMNPQNASRASSMKKYIEDKQVPKKRNKDQDQEPRDQTDDGCKWVKTDSEYIVLEI
ncbi:hypothetical protein FNV43_RR08107 [Rhamnella rubrinervis]|uniref:Uncharacterized protein n=1 Tax=Rhamnella rubrinervis TaxID=2594499 RepID=A0A8K0HFX9_9ROSA|nr:hypothetical protein FNV43_RR08107 [Rhamnella rubrinervis]